MESASAWTTLSQPLKIAIVGAGWAGLAAAITATQKGHQVSLIEASKFWGGRARSIHTHSEDFPPLDNGQHILIGAYHKTLSMMQTVGIHLEKAFWPILNFKKESIQLLSFQHSILKDTQAVS